MPKGFARTEATVDSFTQYLRSLPLKENTKIRLWNGEYLPEGSYNTTAVIDAPLLFNEDLEQCADFSMRFWAEYLQSVDELNQLSLFDFYGRKKAFSNSKKTFRDYLKWHMRYSNSYSLKLGLNKVPSLSELGAGDVFVQNESEEGIGHVSVVVDEAVEASGLKVYLVGYGFMPAQEFHIERADNDYGVEGWFTADGYALYAEKVFGSFGQPQIMRFQKDRSN